MKVGDLVRIKIGYVPPSAPGLIVDVIQKKVWRTQDHDRGVMVNWDKVDAEPHAVVLYAHNDGTINIPLCDLELIHENC